MQGEVAVMSTAKIDLPVHRARANLELGPMENGHVSPY
jgi:hypothetical protein